MKTLKVIIISLLACPSVYCDGAVSIGPGLLAELPTIRKAAIRNHIIPDTNDWYILLAIRKAENGGQGKEFGIKHPKAWNTNLDTQAGWAAATVQKNRQRWIKAGRSGEFIVFLADRYCPKECDPVGNINWKKNVKYWFRRFKTGT